MIVLQKLGEYQHNDERWTSLFPHIWTIADCEYLPVHSLSVILDIFNNQLSSGPAWIGNPDMVIYARNISGKIMGPAGKIGANSKQLSPKSCGLKMYNFTKIYKRKIVGY